MNRNSHVRGGRGVKYLPYFVVWLGLHIRLWLGLGSGLEFGT